jgi:anti-sigma factor RsiW
MRCARAKALLQLYVDSRLKPAHLAALEAHLDRCTHCQHELALLEAICASAAEAVVEPPDLTDRILARIAMSEARRAATTMSTFGLRWGDGLRAVLLATATTLLFILLSPALRLSVGSELNHSFPELAAALLAPGPGSIAWIAWLVWIVAGLVLTLWLAGAEVRSAWRRSLLSRMPQLPQMRQLW